MYVCDKALFINDGGNVKNPVTGSLSISIFWFFALLTKLALIDLIMLLSILS